MATHLSRLFLSTPPTHSLLVYICVSLLRPSILLPTQMAVIFQKHKSDHIPNPHLSLALRCGPESLPWAQTGAAPTTKDVDNEIQLRVQVTEKHGCEVYWFCLVNPKRKEVL